MFSNKLKQILKTKHLSRYALSKMTRIPQPTINRYCNDQRQPTLENVIKIANALCISLDYFKENDNEFVDYVSLFERFSSVFEGKIVLIVPDTINEYKILKAKFGPKNAQNESFSGPEDIISVLNLNIKENQKWGLMTSFYI